VFHSGLLLITNKLTQLDDFLVPLLNLLRQRDKQLITGLSIRSDGAARQWCRMDSIQPFIGRDLKRVEETFGIRMRANDGTHERHHAEHLADVEGDRIS